MYIELIDLLRCPRPHADSWLVAAFNRMDGRFVVEGRLGCPVCSASYRITGGVADLRDGEPADIEPSLVTARGSDEAAVRVAAFMGLTKPSSIVVLAGSSANLGQQVSEIAEARVIALNPAVLVQETERVASVLTDTRLPFAPGSVDGIMLDESTMAFASDAARILRQGGRLIAPAGANLGAAFRELARDEREVVAESIGELITLSR